MLVRHLDARTFANCLEDAMSRAVPLPGDPEHRSSPVETAACALVAALGALLAAAPVLGVYFHDDDFLHLFEITNFGPLAFITAPYAGHMCLVMNSIFFLNFLAFGMHAGAYLAGVVATHIANVLLLFVLVRRLTGSARIACFGGLLFAVCPANDGTLGWYSVHGHTLVALFVLAGLLLLLPEREDVGPMTTRRALGVALCMFAASQSWGSGVAVALLTPVAAALLRPDAFRSRGAAAMLLAVPVLVGLAMAALYLPRTEMNTDPMRSVGLLAHFAVDWRHVLPMVRHTLSLGIVSLVLGAAYPLDRYPDAVSIATTAAFALATLWALRRGSSQARRRLVAFLILTLGAYTIVAAGRAAFLAGIQSGALVHAYVAATRYHYLPQVLLTLVLCLVLAEAARWLTPSSRTTGVLLAAWVVWAVASVTVLRTPVARFDAVRDLVARQREAITSAVLAHPPGTTVCLPNEPVPVVVGFAGTVGIFMLFNHEDALDGRRVYFVSSDPAVLAMREQGGRLGSLLLPAGGCPPRAG